MRLVSKITGLGLLILIALGLAWFVTRDRGVDQFETVETHQLSPWHSLTAVEIEQASAAVKSRHGEQIIINRISLRQPDKADALAWVPDQTALRGADITFRANRVSYRVFYDFATASLDETRTLETGQPMLSPDGEILPAVMQANELPQLLAALERRGVKKGDGLCLPRTIGRYFADRADPVDDRLLRLDCFNIRGQSGLRILPSTSAYARPIEGLSVLYNVETGDIVDIIDSYSDGEYPPHDIVALEYHKGAIETREALKPIDISQPDGVNFTLNGERVDWQGWQFHLRFDPRQGTVLNRVGHNTSEGFRSVAYEVAMSEMFVPYQDNDVHWFYRAYFDMGEYGFGNMATALQGSDCPDNAVFRDAVLHSADGLPVLAENRVCIFEHDPGYPIWRHHEPLYDGVPGIEPHQSRRSTELIVRMVATIGNYDYFQDYVFQQDGRLRIRLVATGVDATKGVFARTLADETAAVETRTGTLIAPHRLGVNHDHFFAYRIDMDIDGTANNFVRHKIQAVPQAENLPRQGIWMVTPDPVQNEVQAQTKMNVEKPALLVFSSAEYENAMGYPSAYQIMMPNVRPLVTMNDATYRRADFVRNNLWVTHYARDELYAAGLPVNQSDADLGMPAYIADNQNIENTDIVAWPVIGFHHVPMAEDWPVMPAKIDEIILKPRNYFDRNPAIDLPD